MADDKDSERPMHSDPNEEAIDEPTTTGALGQWLAVAALALVVLAAFAWSRVGV